MKCFDKTATRDNNSMNRKADVSAVGLLLEVVAGGGVAVVESQPTWKAPKH